MTSSGLRLLWKSNAPHVGSGYGTQANSLLPRMMAHPAVEDVAIFGYFGIVGGLVELPVGRGVPRVKNRMMLHYPVGADTWGNDVANFHAQHFGAHAMITLLDVWVYDDDFGEKGFLWLPYSPVDHEPIPPGIVDKLRKAFHPIAYSRHASQEMKNNEIQHSYIPHGVETDVFKPYSRSAKRKAKRWLGMGPENFVIGTVAANKGWPSRKGFQELMEAFQIFHERHPESLLYLHSDTQDAMGGPNLADLSKQYGIADHIRLTLPYIVRLGFSTREMVRLYNAFDVFTLPSMGEGFGIPIIEAQACGIPVAVSDWTACAELCGSGWKVAMGKKFATPLKSWQRFVDVDALVESWEEAYKVWKDPPLRQEYEDKARQFALGYDYEKIFNDSWAPFLDWLWDTVRPKSIVKPEGTEWPTKATSELQTASSEA